MYDYLAVNQHRTLKNVLTVKDFLEMPGFTEFKILAGKKGLNRRITSVNVIDAPDNDIFFKGGELLLTAAYIMKDDPFMLKDIIEKVAKLNVAALAIKLERFLWVLPPEVVETAEKLDFPLLLLPGNFPFVDIIKPVFEEIIDRQVVQLRFSENVHQSFTELVLKGATAQEIINTLSGIIHKEIVYDNSYFEELIATPGLSLAGDTVSETLGQLRQENTSYPIKMDGCHFGYLIVMPRQAENNRNRGDFAEIAIEHALTVLKLDIQKHISQAQVESKYRDEFIQDLLLNNFTSLEQVQAKEALYHWHFAHGLQAFVFEVEDDLNAFARNRIHDIFAAIRRQINAVYPSAVYTNFTKRIICLLEPSQERNTVFGKQLNVFLAEVINHVQQKFQCALYVGVGAYRADLLDVHHSYEEAQQALQIGKKTACKICFYEQLGLFKLLASICDTRAAQELCERYLGRLSDYDKMHKSDLLHTLQCLVQNDWNLKETAQALYIHYNTAKYRYSKIGEILAVDLHQSEVRMSIALSLKLALFL